MTNDWVYLLNTIAFDLVVQLEKLRNAALIHCHHFKVYDYAA